MSNHDPKLPPLTPPWWMNGKALTTEPQEPAMLAEGTQSFWQRIHGWLLWPLTQLNPLTCDIGMLNLLAWERNIVRFRNEPIWLYRKRVAYAFINAKDAGSTQGFIEIMSRLGITVLSIDERQIGRDWDIVSIELDDRALSNSLLLNTLIQDYGRTCRRYEYVANRAAAALTPITECNNDYQTFTARNY